MSTDSQALWISEYDYPNRCLSLTRADPPGGPQHWTGIEADRSISDRAGRFIAYRATGNDANVRIVKVAIALTPDGDLAAVHPDFNVGLVGSMTLWPYKYSRLHEHWVWWSRGGIFTSDRPSPWPDEV